MTIDQFACGFWASGSSEPLRKGRSTFSHSISKKWLRRQKESELLVKDLAKQTESRKYRKSKDRFTLASGREALDWEHEAWCGSVCSCVLLRPTALPNPPSQPDMLLDLLFTKRRYLKIGTKLMTYAQR